MRVDRGEKPETDSVQQKADAGWGLSFSLFWYSHLHLDLLHQPVAQTPVLEKKDQSASQRKHYSTECFTREIQHSAVL